MAIKVISSRKIKNVYTPIKGAKDQNSKKEGKQ